ncbi:flavin reductase family protein [Spirochaetota bacterium]
MDFKIIKPEEIRDNVFKMTHSDWMLITAGTKDLFNTMTASWGGFGTLWHKSVCTIYVRPTRYTYEFLEKSDNFTLSFFDDKFRDALNFCGSNSGRDVDKISQTGLTPVESNDGSIIFNEARLAIECRKVYYEDFNPGNFIDVDIEKNYPKKDYHRVYVGEILSCYAK